ncbi:MAG: UDP-N-acetylglucosamine transferase subunit ALG14 [Bacteroidales bacterium]|nr:UDP-N-acetylglucosamine transferase subunit ALG14 [Clostridium sp.]MCM1203286.1 UDP-N-acetylglucosamine transferase subunit ALG14 [Bacteroidales bacterium]
MNDKKICFAASSGGHMEEMARLKALVKDGDIVLTENGTYNVVDWCSNVYYMKQINRKETLFVFKFIILFFYSVKILIKEKPNIIISTGALVTVPICLIAKTFGIKVIYIESFARIDDASLTGKIMYRIADLFLVQWEEMLKIFPNAKYVGGIF